MNTYLNVNYNIASNSLKLNQCPTFKANPFSKSAVLFRKAEILKSIPNDDKKMAVDMLKSFSSPKKLEQLFNKYGKEALLSTENEKNVNYIHLLCSVSKNPESIQKAVELFGEDVFYASDEMLYSPLEMACKYNNNKKVIKKLIEIFGQDTISEIQKMQRIENLCGSILSIFG